MNRTLGLSFMPDGNATQPLQSAIKILSMRLPTMAAPGGIAPQALLQSPGGAGVPGAAGNVNADLLALFRRLLASSGGAVSQGSDAPDTADQSPRMSSGDNVLNNRPDPAQAFPAATGQVGAPRIIPNDVPSDASPSFGAVDRPQSDVPVMDYPNWSSPWDRTGGDGSYR